MSAPLRSQMQDFETWYTGLLEREVADGAIVRTHDGCPWPNVEVFVVIDVDHPGDSLTLYSPRQRQSITVGSQTVSAYRVHGPAPADPTLFEYDTAKREWRPKRNLCPRGCEMLIHNRAMPYASALPGSTVRDSVRGSIALIEELTCHCMQDDQPAMDAVHGTVVVGGVLVALVLGLRPIHAARASFQPCQATLSVVWHEDGAFTAQSGSLMVRLVHFRDGDDVAINFGDGREGKLRAASAAAVVRALDLLGEHVGLAPLS